MTSVWDFSPEQRIFLFAGQTPEYAFLILDPQGKVVDWSAGAEQLMGWTRAEILGKYAHRIFTPEDRKAGMPQMELETARQEGKSVDFRWHMRKDGSRFFADGILSALRFEGRIVGFGKIIHDITERKRIADASEQEASFLALSFDAVFSWDFESENILYWNRGAEELYGFATPEALSKPCHVLLATAFPADLAEVKASLKTTGRWQGALTHTTKSGASVQVDSHMHLRADLGSRAIVLEMNRDITQRVRAVEALKASEERFRSLAELSPDGILVNRDGRYVYANPAAMRLLGAKEASELIGRSPFDLAEPPFHNAIKERVDQVLRGDAVVPMADQRWRRLDGSVMYVQTTASKVVWAGLPAVQVLVRDVTELKQAQDRLSVLNERLKLVIEGTGEGIWDCFIPDKKFTFLGGLTDLFGPAPADMSGTEEQWLARIHPEDKEWARGAFYAAVEGKTPIYVAEYRMRGRDGAWKWLRVRGVVVERDQDGNPLLMTGTAIDITARKESDELVWRHANLDTLTGLPNRRMFFERLELELRKAKRTDRQLALLFIDLDGFKQVNDLYGHEAGDLLLMEAAHRLKMCVRETDALARLGGDEFTVLLTGLSELTHLEFVCQKILNSLAESFWVGKETTYVSGSIGVSLFPMDAASAEDLVRKADQAMYAAKHGGKNQFSYFTKEMDEDAHSQLRITNELHAAVRENQLAVHYQPVVDLASGRIVKAEALLRWTHPLLGNIEPARFIPMAEESGLIRQIGNWVFAEAAACCKRCSELLRAPFQISVNNSPMQLMSSDTDAQWLDYLAEQGLPGNSITVEITEGVLLHASSKVASKLAQYRDAGVQVALDDFGTGYASLSYLQKFQIDYVKIDQSFVRNITTDRGNQTIAETIIVMAHKLGLKVIAEGIETSEQLQSLLAAGCDYGQGFLFSSAVPADKLLRMMAETNLQS